MAFWIWSIAPDNYPAFLRAGTFAVRRQGKKAMQQIRPGDRVFAYLSGSKVIAGEFEAVGAPFEDAAPLVPGKHYGHRIRVRPVVALPSAAWVPFDAFARDLSVLEEYDEIGDPDRQFRAVVQRVVHLLPQIDGKVLQFLVRAREGADQGAILRAYEEVRLAQREEKADRGAEAQAVREPDAPYAASLGDFDYAEAMDALLAFVAGQGFVYAPWEIAAYACALRTKPFAILAGVVGVGKSRLPQLVAEGTGGACAVLPVRPDWTDPADVLGYADLHGRFRPGALLQAARRAADDPARQHTLVLDEMNLARPEHYLAEVLSRIEGRTRAGTPPLLNDGPTDAPPEWATLGLPPNLALVGTVNVDESAHPISRKVLDRAFTLDLAPGSLLLQEDAEPAEATVWPAEAWQPLALRLSELAELSDDESAAIERAIGALEEASAILRPAGFAVGYRTRDEVALFALHARAFPDAFRTAEGERVDPLDLALVAKLLPRLSGGHRAFRDALHTLAAWAANSDSPPRPGEESPRDLLDRFAAGRPDSLPRSGGALPGARFPRTAARLARMAERLHDDGYAAFFDA